VREEHGLVLDVTITKTVVVTRNPPVSRRANDQRGAFKNSAS
jgi:hypothetical protein